MPARPRGLPEPCATMSGKHGSEEGGAGKRHPLSDNSLHWVRDVTFDEDRSTVRTGTGPQVMASLRNTAVNLHRLAGATNIAHACRTAALTTTAALNLLANPQIPSSRAC